MPRNHDLCVRGCGRPRKPDAKRCAICTAKSAESMWRRRQTASQAKRGPAPTIRGWNYETDDLITEHVKMARIMAWQAKAKMPSSSSVDVDDMIGDALYGLVVAGRTFDASYEVPFGAWATTQVRGAIWDGIRRWTRNGKQQYVQLDERDGS